jgi:hypothetical protein
MNATELRAVSETLHTVHLALVNIVPQPSRWLLRTLVRTAALVELAAQSEREKENGNGR